MNIPLMGVLIVAVVTAVVGLLVKESYRSTPWLADKFMRWSVRLRYADNPQRAAIRGEELISLLADLPTLFKLPTAAAFLLRALASRAAHGLKHTRCEPQAVQFSRETRFRLALAKVILVILCAGAAFEIESMAAFRPVDILALVACGLTAGISVASTVVARQPRFHPRLARGILFTLPGFVLFSVFGDHGVLSIPVVILSGTAFGLAHALSAVFTGTSGSPGFALGISTSPIFVCIANALFLNTAGEFCALGIAVGLGWSQGCDRTPPAGEGTREWWRVTR